MTRVRSVASFMVQLRDRGILIVYDVIPAKVALPWTG